MATLAIGDGALQLYRDSREILISRWHLDISANFIFQGIDSTNYYAVDSVYKDLLLYGFVAHFKKL